MPAAFEWAVLRVVPRVERGESVNVGVILYCGATRFLAARLTTDRDRVLALDPKIDLEALERALAMIPRICEGDPAAGPVGQLSPRERFEWLVSPRSTITQPSAVHAGICQEPAAALDSLFERMVAA